MGGADSIENYLSKIWELAPPNLQVGNLMRYIHDKIYYIIYDVQWRKACFSQTEYKIDK